MGQSVLFSLHHSPNTLPSNSVTFNHNTRHHSKPTDGACGREAGLSHTLSPLEEAVCQSPSLPGQTSQEGVCPGTGRRTRPAFPEDTRPAPGPLDQTSPLPGETSPQFSAMATSAKRKQEETHLKMLREMTSLPANRKCFDCDQRGPTYVNMTVGSFVCTTCSGIL